MGCPWRCGHARRQLRHLRLAGSNVAQPLFEEVQRGQYDAAPAPRRRMRGRLDRRLRRGGSRRRNRRKLPGLPVLHQRVLRGAHGVPLPPQPRPADDRQVDRVATFEVVEVRGEAVLQQAPAVHEQLFLRAYARQHRNLLLEVVDGPVYPDPDAVDLPVGPDLFHVHGELRPVVARGARRQGGGEGRVRHAGGAHQVELCRPVLDPVVAELPLVRQRPPPHREPLQVHRHAQQLLQLLLHMEDRVGGPRAEPELGGRGARGGFVEKDDQLDRRAVVPDLPGARKVQDLTGLDLVVEQGVLVSEDLAAA
mmetsp:Transcript_72384/g.204581  ORF Transcript_72384/g.204581 Transcript_72384/m.204581 type:complete len:308 (+) Transcript_72384:101-1024(+)